MYRSEMAGPSSRARGRAGAPPNGYSLFFASPHILIFGWTTHPNMIIQFYDAYYMNILLVNIFVCACTAPSGWREKQDLSFVRYCCTLRCIGCTRTMASVSGGCKKTATIVRASFSTQARITALRTAVDCQNNGSCPVFFSTGLQSTAKSTCCPCRGQQPLCMRRFV